MNSFRKVVCRGYQIAFRLILPVLPYREPEILENMEAIPSLLKKRGIRAILMVSGRSARRHEKTKTLEAMLAQEGIACRVYDRTVPNPTVQNVEEALALYRQVGAQAILAIGGGSVMDCAKIVGARVARPGKPVMKMRGLLKVLRPTPLTIAVPSTAGSGSETTLAAVITDERTHHKYPINDFALIPDYAVLEPELTVGLPPGLTATTGMDALTHAVEAYIGRSTTKLTRAMAEEAVDLVAHNLLQAFEHGDDRTARRNMLRAAYCAGVSFTRSYVGYVHAVAHSLGGRYGVAHGLANAIILPYFLDAYGVSCHKKLARLARKAGIAAADDNDAVGAKKFIAWVREMNAEMGIPTVIPEYRTWRRGRIKRPILFILCQS